MQNRLILKVTKFQLPPPTRLGTVVKNILGAIIPPMSNRVKSQYKPNIGNVVDNSPSISIRLEKLRFQTFDGDTRKYPKFKAEFQKYTQPLCKSDEIAFILRSYLIDEISEKLIA